MDPISDDTIPAAIRTALAAQRAVFRALHRDHMPDWATSSSRWASSRPSSIVATRQPTNVSGLAEALALSKPTASMLVDRLVQLGFVARTEDPDDRRRTLVTPTPEGAALVLRLRQGSVDRLVRWLGAARARRPGRADPRPGGPRRGRRTRHPHVRAARRTLCRPLSPRCRGVR